MECTNIKDAFKKIANKEGLTLQDILNKYNWDFRQNVAKQSFNRMLQNNNIKFNLLVDILNNIGYKIEIKKKL